MSKRSYQTQEIDGVLCVSSNLLQQCFNVSRQALGNWAQNGCPKMKPGWWPLVDVIRWRGLTSTAGDDDDGLSDGALKLKYEAEVKRLQAQQLEFKNRVASGEFVAQAEIVAELSRYFTELKRNLTGLARKLATEVGPFVDPASARRIERDLEELVNGALDRMSTGETYVPSTKRVVKAEVGRMATKRNGGAQAPRTTKRKRVGKQVSDS